MSSGDARADSQPWNDREFIFVGGMHRSGTTLLASILGASGTSTGLESSGAHMGEGQFLQDVYPIGKAYGGVTGWALDPASRLTESDAARIPDAAERLWQSWSPHWDLDARFLVEKTPLNLTKTRFLQALFPRSRFVIITRHPVTQSLAVKKWHPKKSGKWGVGFSRLIENWVRAHDAFEQDVAHLERVHVVRYETLLSDPAPQIERLERFLEIDLDGAAERFDTSRASGYADEWDRLLGRRKTTPTGTVKERAKDRISRTVIPREFAAARRAFGSRIADLGYDLEDLGSARPWQPSRSASADR